MTMTLTVPGTTPQPYAHPNQRFLARQSIEAVGSRRAAARGKCYIPSTSPSSDKSIRWAAGFAGNPGMVTISPVRAST